MQQFTDRLYYLTQDLEDCSHLQQISIAVGEGVHWIQLRSKRLPESALAATISSALRLMEGTTSRLIINDHVELAGEYGAHGVHLGLKDMPIGRAREILGPEAIIGGTANTPGDIRQRLEEGADYIGLGPYRFTATKEKLSPVLGIGGIRSIAAGLDRENRAVPIFAIGGIRLVDVRHLLDAGLYGVAVASAVNRSDKPAEALRQFNGLIAKWAYERQLLAAGPSDHQKNTVHEHR